MSQADGFRFTAAIFDLDGLLIDSEPFWQDAEMEILGRAGVVLTRDECLQTTGLRTEKVVGYWFERRPWDASRFPLSRLTADINARVIEHIRERGEAKRGVRHAINYVGRRGLRRAVASSSSMNVINTALERLGIAGHFEIVHSVDFEANSKPAPDVYLGAARKLNIAPKACLALEDSIAGLQAAKAAGMTCLWVPEAPWRGHRQRQAAAAQGARADAILDSLLDLDDGVWDELVGAAAVRS